MAIPGVLLEDIVRGVMGAGLYGASMGTGEELVKNRMELHRNTPSSHELKLADGWWLNVNQYATHDSGTLILHTDIT